MFNKKAIVFSTVIVVALGIWSSLGFQINNPGGGAVYSSGSTVGFGGFWGGLGIPYQDVARTAGAGNIAVNNLVRVLQFQTYGTQTVGHISLVITTLVSPCTMDVGLYDASGNKLVNAGGIDCSTTGNKTAAPTQVTIPPQTLYLAFCGTSSGTIATMAYSSLILGALGTNGLQQLGNGTDLININGSRWATAANSCTAGVLPPTLGALTPATASLYPPATWFEP